MTDEQKKDSHSLPIPDPYLFSATDQYYGVTPSMKKNRQ